MKKILIFVFCFGFLCTQAYAERYALLVGVSKYQHIDGLEGPEYDVEAMRKVLERNWGFKRDSIIELVNRNASKAKILAAIDTLTKKSRRGDQLFIYFSGHGTGPFDKKTKWHLSHDTGALLPYDFHPVGTQAQQIATAIVGRDDLNHRLSWLDENGRHVFFVVDACYSRNATKSLFADNTPSKRFSPLSSRSVFDEDEDLDEHISTSPQQIVETPYPYKNVFTLAAAGKKEEAIDIRWTDLDRFPTFDSKPHGAMSDALLRVLRGDVLSDHDGDGQLSYWEVFNAVQSFMAERGYPHNAQRQPSVSEDEGGLAQASVMGIIPSLNQVRTGDALQLKPLRIKALGFESLTRMFSRYPELVVGHQEYDLRLLRVNNGIQIRTPGNEDIGSFPAGHRDQIIKRLRIEAWFRSIVTPINNKQRFSPRLTLARRGQGDSNKYQACETAPELSISTEKTAYLLMFNLNPLGDINVLYPINQNELNHPVRAHREIKLGGMSVGAPYGYERLVVMAFNDRENLVEKLNPNVFNLRPEDRTHHTFSIDDPEFLLLNQLLHKQNSYAKHQITVRTGRCEF